MASGVPAHRAVTRRAVTTGGAPCKARIYLVGFHGLSAAIEVARNAFANRDNPVTCTYTF